MNPKPKTYFGSPKCHKNAQILTQYFYEFTSDQSTSTQNIIILPLRFGNAGRVWFCGARETHSTTCHNEVTPRKTREFLKSPCFFRSLW